MKFFPKEIDFFEIFDKTSLNITKAASHLVDLMEHFDNIEARAKEKLRRGRKAGEEKYKHFGAAGTPGSHAKPYVSSRGAEVGRGRRSSTGYKRSAFKHRQ